MISEAQGRTCVVVLSCWLTDRQYGFQICAAFYLQIKISFSSTSQPIFVLPCEKCFQQESRQFLARVFECMVPNSPFVFIDSNHIKKKADIGASRSEVL
ncbi:MAG: hypothetical protein ACKPKO_20900, partial [Candidatus Fonsibacter sp.]